LLPIPFWAEAVNTACYVQNRVLVTKPLNKTPYELLHGFGPAWLFDIDSLSQTMNYHPVLAENQSNPTAGFQDTAKVGEEATQTYVLFRVLSDVSAVGLDFTNSTNDFTAAGPLVSAAGLNFTNSTNDFNAAGPSNADMPNLEDLSHDADDVGADADTNNMESI
nr:retrovirus-related Pol polyprotein from transposon TNT 1-94 [Tanacetum cinerariifolium]